jgi:hypothetical protein
LAKVSPGVWVLAAPAVALEPLAPLLAARRERQPVAVVTTSLETVLGNPAAHLPADTAALLVVGPRRCGPFRSLPGLWLHERWSPSSGRTFPAPHPTPANIDALFQNRRVPVGWLPNAPIGLAIYAHAGARALNRPHSLGALAVLGQWEDRFLRVALRTSRWFEKHPAKTVVLHWTADRLSRPDLLTGLRHGPGAAIYYGHGRANGWAGYHGVRIGDFIEPWPEPIGVLFALCCENASRRGNRLSFAEQLVLKGVCGSMLAATRKTLHSANRQLGPALCEVLTQHPQLTLADAVEKMALPPEFWRRTPYRFIGDPLMPLAAASHAAERSTALLAPAPDAVLPPWESPPVTSLVPA